MASGGTITRVNQDIIHTFTASGDFVCDFYGTVEVLIVAGGGGGGSYLAGGGGGGGGVIYARRISVSPQTYSIVVGTGGGSNTNGNNSVAFGYTSIGGGAGGGAGVWNAGDNGSAGGSGGGASGEYYVVKTGGTATSGQGQAGGNSATYFGSAYAGGGGGGIAGVGGASGGSSAGGGGAGYACDISGSIQYYGAGGGGSVYREGGSVSAGVGGSGVGGNGSVGGVATVAGSNGAANSGSGGGGNSSTTGYSGGSGIVIIRYNPDGVIRSSFGLREGVKELIKTPLFNDPALIAYYRFEANSVDSKNGINGTDYNVAYYTGGVFVGDSGFNGSNSRIDLPNSTLFDVQRLSISVWVYSANFAQNGFIFEKGSVNTQYSLFFEGDYINFRTVYPGFSDWADVSTYCRLSESGMVNGTWNHIVATYDGFWKRIYVNGQLAYCKKFVATLITGQSGERIGAYGGASPSYWFNGALDDLAIFNRALSAQEVAYLFSQPPPLIKYNRDRIPGKITGV